MKPRPLPPKPAPGRWEIFESWHKEASLWREIYARTVSGGIVLLAGYTVAALSGFVSPKPVFIGIGCFLVLWFTTMRPGKRGVLFRLKEAGGLALSLAGFCVLFFFVLLALVGLSYLIVWALGLDEVPGPASFG